MMEIMRTSTLVGLFVLLILDGPVLVLALDVTREKRLAPRNIIDDSQTVDVGENGTAASSFAEASKSFFYGNQTSRTGSSSTGSSESTDGTTRRRPRLRGAARYSTFVSLSTGTGAGRPGGPGAGRNLSNCSFNINKYHKSQRRSR
ncbi:unnamed protein product [Amoebophrya sp. A25]|nr:unnamed protein product [Amoebophrya sp. A25]|eukprot:GSA25T00002401001.1